MLGDLADACGRSSLFLMAASDAAEAIRTILRIQETKKQNKTKQNCKETKGFLPLLFDMFILCIQKYSQKQPLEVFHKKGALKTFSKLTGKHLRKSKVKYRTFSEGPT